MQCSLSIASLGVLRPQTSPQGEGHCWLLLTFPFEFELNLISLKHCAEHEKMCKHKIIKKKTSFDFGSNCDEKEWQMLLFLSFPFEFEYNWNFVLLYFGVKTNLRLREENFLWFESNLNRTTRFQLLRWVVKAKVIVIQYWFWVHSAALDKMTFKCIRQMLNIPISKFLRNKLQKYLRKQNLLLGLRHTFVLSEK